MPYSVNPTAVVTAMPPPTDSFQPVGAVQPLGSKILRFAAEVAFVGMLAEFVLSPGSITDRHRVVMVLLGLWLPGVAWAVYSMRISGAASRLWLLFGAGFALSMAVAKTNLQRPPATPAADCAMAVGVLALLALAVEYFARRSRPSDTANGHRQPLPFCPTHFEAGIIAAVLVFVGVMVALFPSVGVQNDLDLEVMHNAIGELADYGLLLLGLSIVSTQRASFCRTAIALGVACLVRVVWIHTTGS